MFRLRSNPAGDRKKPTDLGRYVDYATVDVLEVDRRWSEVHPRFGPRSTCGVGCPTGRWPARLQVAGPGLVVLDRDDMGSWAIFARGRPTPLTLTITSDRPGQPRDQLVFGAPAGVCIRNSASGLAPKIDVRGEGGLIVLPGSLHPSGSTYRTVVDVPPAPLPAWLVDELLAHERERKRSRAPAPAAMPQAVLEPGLHAAAYARALDMLRRACASARTPTGRRHDVSIGLAWDGLARGLAPADVRGAVRAGYLARAYADEPVRAAEAVRELDRALAAPPAASRPCDPRWSVEGQARWLLAHDPRWRPALRPAAVVGRAGRDLSGPARGTP